MNQSALLREQCEKLRTLDEVFRWALRQTPRFHPADVVIQDEYSHDILFRAADDSYLVIDAT